MSTSRFIPFLLAKYNLLTKLLINDCWDKCKHLGIKVALKQNWGFQYPNLDKLWKCDIKMFYVPKNSTLP